MRASPRSRFLIDTHLLIWWLAEASRLSTRASSLIANPANTLFISAVTLWEIRLKQSLGKLQVPERFEIRLESEPFENLPLTAAHTKRLVELPLHHRDPFDRMLIAQAREESLIFLTADERLTVYGESVWLV